MELHWGSRRPSTIWLLTLSSLQLASYGSARTTMVMCSQISLPRTAKLAPRWPPRKPYVLLFHPCVREEALNMKIQLNASIVMPDADLDLAFKGSVFAAVGTCGQRCTSLRSLLINDSVFDKMTKRMVSAYKTIKIGDPLDPETLVGPLHSREQV